MGRRPTIPRPSTEKADGEDEESRPSTEKADGEDEEEMVEGIGWSKASQFGIIAASSAIRTMFIAEYFASSLP